MTLAGALGFSVAAQQALVARTELGRAQSRVLEARLDLRTIQERLKRSAVRSGPEQGAIARALAARESPPSKVLGDLVALMPAGVRVDRLDLAYGREVEIEAQVVARRVADYDEFMERLAGSKRFASVEPGPETREAELRASVRALYRTGPNP